MICWLASSNKAGLLPCQMYKSLSTLLLRHQLIKLNLMRNNNRDFSSVFLTHRVFHFQGWLRRPSQRHRRHPFDRKEEAAGEHLRRVHGKLPDLEPVHGSSDEIDYQVEPQITAPMRLMSINHNATRVLLPSWIRSQVWRVIIWTTSPLTKRNTMSNKRKEDLSPKITCELGAHSSSYFCEM